MELPFGYLIVILLPGYSVRAAISQLELTSPVPKNAHDGREVRALASHGVTVPQGAATRGCHEKLARRPNQFGRAVPPVRQAANKTALGFPTRL